jgi:homoserine kinase type II
MFLLITGSHWVMAVKSEFSKSDFVQILSDYELGQYKDSCPLSDGTVQTNYIVKTTDGTFVFRCYENRSYESVMFEVNLIQYLKKRNYPCPALFTNRNKQVINFYKGNPCVFIEFIEGQHVETLNINQRNEVIKQVAILQRITQNYRPAYKKFRWNYGIALCEMLAREKSEQINTENSRQKFLWYQNELGNLQLPNSLPKGVCHCDFHFTNILFRADNFVALLDFDDANYTYIVFDVVSLIDSWAWSHEQPLSFSTARMILQEYNKHRRLNTNEKRHIFDVLKLQIMLDCIWYFERGLADDFFEKRKIEYLDTIGREEFYNRLFD